MSWVSLFNTKTQNNSTLVWLFYSFLWFHLYWIQYPNYFYWYITTCVKSKRILQEDKFVETLQNCFICIRKLDKNSESLDRFWTNFEINIFNFHPEQWSSFYVATEDWRLLQSFPAITEFWFLPIFSRLFPSKLLN